MEQFLIVKKTDYGVGEYGELYTDGACRGNGSKNSISGAGAVLFDQHGNVRFELRKYLGKGLTNNIAEYKALILGLTKSLDIGIKSIHVYVDSKLICEQVRGNYRVKKPHLKKFFDRVVALVAQFEKFKIISVLRHLNRHADRLANESIIPLR